TSLNEGTPLTMIEAMACARPVVASEVGGIVDLMGTRGQSNDGVTVWDHGVTIKGHDPESFSRALRFLIAERELRLRMGQQACQFVRSHFSKERLLDDIANLYTQLTASKSGVEFRAVTCR